jgi:hypothetical protein
MSYRIPEYNKSQLNSVESLEGERIESKIERIVSNNEPITDGAPTIYTERKAGVVAAYNVRTDRWEVAADAMDLVEKSVSAKRDVKAGKKASSDDSGKVVKLDVSEAESTQGTKEAK